MIQSEPEKNKFSGLTLAEQLLLLALNDEKGTVVSGAVGALDFGIVGALLLEMAESGMIAIQDGKLMVQGDPPTGSPVSDEILSILRAKKGKLKPLRYWVPRLANKIRKLRHKIADGLVKRGILRREEKRILGIFPSLRYPTVNPLPELEVRERLKDAVLSGTSPIGDVRMILNLVKASNLSDEVFGKSARKQVKNRLKELADSPGDSEEIGEAVSETVQAVQTAVLAAVATAVIVSSAASSH